VNFEVALAVFDAAVEDGVAQVDVPKEDRRGYAEARRWKPEYVEYEYDPKGIK
jgi:malate dehydrogenase (oxaloacetate-decarboxylating)